MRTSIRKSVTLKSLDALLARSLMVPGIVVFGAVALPNLLVALPVSAQGGGETTQSADTSGQVAGVVNGKEILVDEVDHVMKSKPAFAMYQTMDHKNAEVLNKLRVSVLNSMIDRELLLEAARKSGLIEDSEVKEKIEEVIARYGGEEKLHEILKTSGVTYEQFMKDLSNDLLINLYLEKSFSKEAETNQEELKKAFDANPQRYAEAEKIRARHILVKVPSDGSSEQEQAARKEIEDLYQKVVAPGADFAAIAKESSQCPSAPRGGDLGPFQKGMMVAPFEEAAFSLKPGEISKPVRTEFGFHIIKVEEHQEAKKADFESAKPKIEKELLHKKRAQLLEARIKDLRKNASIEIKISGT